MKLQPVGKRVLVRRAKALAEARAAREKAERQAELARLGRDGMDDLCKQYQEAALTAEAARDAALARAEEAERALAEVREEAGRLRGALGWRLRAALLASSSPPPAQAPEGELPPQVKRTMEAWGRQTFAYGQRTGQGADRATLDALYAQTYAAGDALESAVLAALAGARSEGREEGADRAFFRAQEDVNADRAAVATAARVATLGEAAEVVEAEIVRHRMDEEDWRRQNPGKVSLSPALTAAEIILAKIRALNVACRFCGGSGRRAPVSGPSAGTAEGTRSKEGA